MPDLDDSAGLLDDKDLEHELEESAAEVPNAWCLTSDAASHGDFCRRDGCLKHSNSALSILQWNCQSHSSFNCSAGC